MRVTAFAVTFLFLQFAGTSAFFSICREHFTMRQGDILDYHSGSTFLALVGTTVP